jgi:hypothetical protein
MSRAGKIFNWWLSGSSGGVITYSTEAQSVFDLMVDELTTNQKNAIAKFIDHQVAASNWDAAKTKINRFFCLGGLSAANALVDWTGRENASLISTPVWNIDDGYTTTDTAVINTNYIPSTDVVAGGLNDAHYGVWCKEIITNATGAFFGCRGSTTSHWILCRQDYTGEDILTRVHGNSHTINDYFENVIVNKTKENLNISICRQSSTIQASKINGQNFKADTSNSSAGLPNTSVYIGAENIANVISTPLNGKYLGWWSTVMLNFDHDAWALGIEQLLYDLGCHSRNILPGTFETKNIDANDILVYVCGGQSNQEGANLFSDYPVAERGPFNCKIWYKPGLALNGSWQNLEGGVNCNNPFNSQTTRVGPELAFARYAATMYPGQVYIIKYAVGGTKLQNDAGATDWYPDNVGEYFDHWLYNYISQALTHADLVGKNVRILMVDWMQGETDCNNGVDTYQADQELLIERFVERMESYGYDLSQTHFTIGRLNEKLSLSVSPRPLLNSIRSAQELNGSNAFFISNPSFVGRLGNVLWYDRDDILIKVSDHTHEEVAGQRYRGLRLFRYFNDLI